MRIAAVIVVLCTVVTPPVLRAQQAPPGGMTHTPGMQHTPGMEHRAPAAVPVQGGQAAFAAIAEVVALLEADSTTDWSRVNIEALRQHLIDMDAVTLRSRVSQSPLSAGLSMSITGDAAAAGSIRRMVGAHAPMLTAAGPWRATATRIVGGMRLDVIATVDRDSATVARIRGLGFIGLMTQGAHHAEHHRMIASGAEGVHGHAHE